MHVTVQSFAQLCDIMHDHSAYLVKATRDELVYYCPESENLTTVTADMARKGKLLPNPVKWKPELADVVAHKGNDARLFGITDEKGSFYQLDSEFHWHPASDLQPCSVDLPDWLEDIWCGYFSPQSETVTAILKNAEILITDNGIDAFTIKVANDAITTLHKLYDADLISASEHSAAIRTICALLRKEA